MVDADFIHCRLKLILGEMLLETFLEEGLTRTVTSTDEDVYSIGFVEVEATYQFAHLACVPSRTKQHSHLVVVVRTPYRFAADLESEESD